MLDKRLLSICKEPKKYIFLTVIANWISVICNIGIILFVGEIINKLFNNDFSFNLGGYVIYLASLMIIRFISNFMAGKFSHNSSGQVRSILREKIYKKLLDLGVNYNDALSTSSTVQIAVDGVEQLEIYFGKFLPQLFYGILGISYIIRQSQ